VRSPVPSRIAHQGEVQHFRLAEQLAVVG
jgi:hypothetical protein